MAAVAVCGTVAVADCVELGLLGLVGKRPRRPLRSLVRTTSLTMPTARHFWKRQY